MKTRLIAAILALISACGCAHAPAVPPVLCAYTLMPKSGYGALSVNGASFDNPGLKYLLTSTKAGAKSYGDFQSAAFISNVLSWSGVVLMCGSLYFMSRDGLSSPAGIGLLAAGFLTIPVTLWQRTESRNNALKSVYQYNYACSCRSRAAAGAPAGEFYYPSQGFFGNLEFVGLCSGDRFSPASKTAISRFKSTPGYGRIINENMAGSMIVLGLGLADTGVLVYAGMNDDITLWNIAAIASWPLALISGSVNDGIYNNIFYLLDIVNLGCCSGKNH
jgi:hypothetical protein